MAKTATGSQADQNFIAESTYGTTPATPTFINMRMSSSTLKLTKGNFQSPEIRADRQVAHSRNGILAVGGDTSIVMSYGTFDDLFEALFGGTWSSDVLKVGNTVRSFTFENRLPDIDTPEWERFTGCQINTFNLSIQPEGMITGAFGIMGQDEATATTAIAGATYGAPTVTEPMDSFQGSILEGGGASAIIQSMDFTITNNIGTSPAIGSNVTLQPPLNKFIVTGTLTAYYQSKALFDKFRNETSSSITVTISDGTSTYAFDFSNVHYTGGDKDIPGDGELSITMPFEALLDTTDVSSMVITRTP